MRNTQVLAFLIEAFGKLRKSNAKNRFSVELKKFTERLIPNLLTKVSLPTDIANQLVKLAELLNGKELEVSHGERGQVVMPKTEEDKKLFFSIIRDLEILNHRWANSFPMGKLDEEGADALFFTSRIMPTLVPSLTQWLAGFDASIIEKHGAKELAKAL